MAQRAALALGITLSCISLQQERHLGQVLVDAGGPLTTCLLSDTLLLGVTVRLH